MFTMKLRFEIKYIL